MRISKTLLGLGAIAFAAPAVAHHVDHLDEAFASRGACEAEVAQLSRDDREFLQDTFPENFSTAGDVHSFLNHAFSCDYDAEAQAWYITDHRLEVLTGDWWLHRKR